MSTTLLYALIMAVGQIVLTLVDYFLGYQTDRINQGAWFRFVPLIYVIVLYTLGIRSVREEAAGKYLRYGQGVGTGALIALYSGLISAVYVYVHYTYVNPGFPDYLIEASKMKWAALGMNDDQMEKAEKGVRMFTKPAVLAAFGFCVSLVFGVIVSLIASAFLKRNPPEEPQAAS